jgi:hypothetical protein
MTPDTTATVAEIARSLARLLDRYADELTGPVARPTTSVIAQPAAAPKPAPNAAPAKLAAPTPAATDDVPCPKCGGPTWDNRASKKNPKAPDYKCKDRSCDGCVWPPREGKAARTTTVPMPVTGNGDWAPVDDDQIPF